METFVYDDECGFCTWWAGLIADRTDEGVVGFSALTEAERKRLPEDWEECAHLLTDDAVYSCGAAIEQALVRADLVPHELLDALGFLVPDYERKRERLYRWVAERRAFWGHVVYAEPPARRDPGSDETEDEGT